MESKCRICEKVFSTKNHAQKICVKCRPKWWGEANSRERSNFSYRVTIPLRLQKFKCVICKARFTPKDKRKLCEKCRPEWFDKATNQEKDGYSGPSSRRRMVPLRFQTRQCRHCSSDFVPEHSSVVVCEKCRPHWWPEATLNERSNWIMMGNVPPRFQPVRSCGFCTAEFQPKKQQEKYCSEKCRKTYAAAWLRNWEKELFEKYPWRKMVARMRGRVNAALKLQQVTKENSTMKMVGMSGKELMVYLLTHENNRNGEFTPQNYGTVWTLDHIIPLAYFDLSKEDQRATAFHYINCQPLPRAENFAKGSFYKGKRHKHGSVRGQKNQSSTNGIPKPR